LPGREPADLIAEVGLLALLTFAAFALEGPVPVARASGPSPSVIRGFSGPYGVAFAPPNGEVYVTNLGTLPLKLSNVVSAIDTSTNSVIENITVGRGPTGIAYAPSDKDMYVTNMAGNTTSVIDTATNTVVAAVTVGLSPSGVAFATSNDDMYVTNSLSNTTSVIDTATNVVVKTIPVGHGPAGIAYDSFNGEMYVANSRDNTTSVIDTATNTVTATIQVGQYPFGVAFAPSNKEVYVTDIGLAPLFSAETSVISTATNSVVARVTLASAYGPAAAAFDSLDDYVYVISLSGAMYAIKTSTNRVVTVIPVDPWSYGIAFAPSNDDLYVTSLTLGTVSVVGTLNTVTCTPLVVTIGGSVTCRDAITGSPKPTGEVTWSSEGHGSFSRESCELSAGGCSVRFTTAAPFEGLLSITASYAGDAHNQGSSGTFMLMVNPATSRTSVSCKSSSVNVGPPGAVTCTAVVAGYKPTGTVSWSQSGGPGSVSFSPNTCSLAKGRCSVTLTGVTSGTVVIKVAYAGDLDNLGSAGTRGLVVI